jgi:hypothetical protein
MLVGVVDRQVDTAVQTVESSARESLHDVEGLLREAEDERPQRGRERSEQPPAGKPEAQRTEARKQNGKQGTKPDRRGFEERTVEELRDRARELDIEGRASMSKDELIAALRDHRQPQQPKGDAQKAQARKQDTTVDRRPFAERNVEELRDRARELEIEGRASMSKDELIAALREQRQPKQPKGDVQKAAARTQDSKIDRRPFAERSVEELRDRARELEIEGRSAMSKDELIAALRQHAK